LALLSVLLIYLGPILTQLQFAQARVHSTAESPYRAVNADRHAADKYQVAASHDEHRGLAAAWPSALPDLPSEDKHGSHPECGYCACLTKLPFGNVALIVQIGKLEASHRCSPAQIIPPAKSPAFAHAPVR